MKNYSEQDIKKIEAFMSSAPLTAPEQAIRTRLAALDNEKAVVNASLKAMESNYSEQSSRFAAVLERLEELCDLAIELQNKTEVV